MAEVEPSPEPNLLASYTPFIADVPLSAYSEPFHPPQEDSRSPEEIERETQRIAKIIKKKKFSKPLPLADFCLAAPQKWDEEDLGTPQCQACGYQ